MDLLQYLPLEEAISRAAEATKEQFPYRAEGDAWGEKWRSLAEAIGDCQGVRVLDVGTGIGEGLSHILTGRAELAVGLDPYLPDPGGWDLRLAPRATRRLLVKGHLGSLPFAPESFDLITAVEVIEHVPVAEFLRFLSRAWELLAPGGRLALSTPRRSALNRLVSSGLMLLDLVPSRHTAKLRNLQKPIRRQMEWLEGSAGRRAHEYIYSARELVATVEAKGFRVTHVGGGTLWPYASLAINANSTMHRLWSLGNHLTRLTHEFSWDIICVAVKREAADGR